MKKCIQAIKAHHNGSKLGAAKELVLAKAGVAAWVFPIALVLSNAPYCQAQSQTGPKPSFEVASIKEAINCGNTAPGVRVKIPGGTFYEPGGRYRTCNLLRGIIMNAYNIDSFSPLAGVPGWSDDILYQIEAKAEGDPDKEQMRLMVQSLLEERFKLKLHSEKREMPVYSLVVAKGGPKLQPSKDENGNPIVSLPPPEQDPQKMLETIRQSRAGLASMPATSAGIVTMSGGGTGSIKLTAKAISMERLVAVLFNAVGRKKVIDKTGLTGLYDIQISYADPNRQQPLPTEPSASPAEPSAPTIFTVVQQELGLKLEEDKALMDYFIIDSVEKPSAD